MTARVPAPFPYVGGKSRIAARVWRELGQPYSFLDPFMGSNAILLARPQDNGRMAREIVGDLNGYVVNAYRSIQMAPDETARYAWWPSFHADLTARHRWLVRWGRYGGLQKLLDDPEYYNPKVAGWWLWGISNWISVSDFCRAAFTGGDGADDNDIPDRTQLRNGKGVQQGRMTTPAVPRSIPYDNLDGSGQGIQVSRIGTPADSIPQTHCIRVGRGVQQTCQTTPAGIGKIPHRKNDGSGQALQLGAVTTPAKPPKQGFEIGGGGVSNLRVLTPQDIPSTERTAAGKGVQNGKRQHPASDDDDPRDRWAPWFRWLAQRLAGVTILNTPWQTVLGSRTLLGDFENRTIGVFLDPPYPTAGRSGNLYALDNGDDTFPAVWQWAKDHGHRANFRIAICGLDGHFGAVPDGWRVYRWRNAGMRSKARPDELVLFSPYCLGDGGDGSRQGTLPF